jgi:hypothetical protein
MHHLLSRFTSILAKQLGTLRLRRAQRRAAIASFLVVALLGLSMPFYAVAGAARMVDNTGFGSVGLALAGASSSVGLTSNPLIGAASAGLHPVAYSDRASIETASSRAEKQPQITYPDLRTPSANRETSSGSLRQVRFAGKASVATARATVSPLVVQSGGQAGAIAGGAVVRHAPQINAARVEGSVRQLLGEDSTLIGEEVTLSGSAVITSDLLVPGTPQVTLNGNPSFGGTVDGTGSAFAWRSQAYSASCGMRR